MNQPIIEEEDIEKQHNHAESRIVNEDTVKI